MPKSKNLHSENLIELQKRIDKRITKLNHLASHSVKSSKAKEELVNVSKELGNIIRGEKLTYKS